MAVFSVPGSALGQFPVWCACAQGRRENMKRRKKSIEEQREIRRERWAGFKEPTVVKEPSSSLHLDTHKYKAQPFELPRRVSSFYLFSLFFRFSFSLLLHLGSPLFLTLLAEQIYFTFLPFLDLSQYLAVLWHSAPVATGTGHQKIRLWALGDGWFALQPATNCCFYFQLSYPSFI